ncbi:MAG: hypothetical protein WC765_08940 [Phycisphaerae bacterium]|jgi:hypothetical protein
MKKSKIIMFIALFIVCYLCFCFYLKISSIKETFLNRVGSCIKLYISQNDGNFPSSREDLFNKGYLTKETVDGNSHIRMKIIQDFFNDWPSMEISSDYKTAYVSGVNFDRFDIRYGVEPKELKLEKNKLFDVHTNKHILLIDGPSKFSLTSYYLPKRYYNFISVELYKEMLYHQNIQKSEPNLP